MDVTTVVVCDDDPILRTAVSGLCEDAGLHVVAETDSGADAIELVQRFNVDVVVLDLSLVDGSGELTLKALKDQERPAEVIVFSAYATDPARLIKLGAREVIHKPDLLGLGIALEQLSAGVERARTEAVDERRVLTRELEEGPELWRSPSGISTARDISHSASHTLQGDTVLVVYFEEDASLEDDVGRLLANDCRLEPGRLLRQTLRIQDVVHDYPEAGAFAAILRGGDARAAQGAWDRLVGLLAPSHPRGVLRGAWARVDELGARAAISRCADALHTAGGGASVLVSA